MQMDGSDRQHENARSSIRRNRELDSNSTVRRMSQPEKHYMQRISIQSGIKIDLSDEHLENARSPIRRN
jgi:hypothetical protein